MKKLRKTAFESSLPAPPTDLVVDAYLSLTPEYSEEEQKLMYVRYVEKVFKKLHPRRVVHLDEKWPLGRWLEATRSSARLTCEDIADALGQSASYVMEIETGEILPWSMPAREIAKLVILFRLHTDALAEMVYASYVVCESRRKLPGDLSVLGLDAGTTGQSVDFALDLYYARNTPTMDPVADVEKWLSDVRNEIRSEARSRKRKNL